MKTKKNPTNVRLPVTLDDRIEELSRRYDISKSALIRQAVAYQLIDWEANGLKYTISNNSETRNGDWKELLITNF